MHKTRSVDRAARLTVAEAGHFLSEAHSMMKRYGLIEAVHAIRRQHTNQYGLSNR
jgi:hypothetical protein